MFLKLDVYLIIKLLRDTKRMFQTACKKHKYGFQVLKWIHKNSLV